MTMEDVSPLTYVAVSPRDARHFVRRTLTALGCPSLIDDAELLVSEVVTNAVLHGGVVNAPVSIERTAEGVRIEVVDPGRLFAPEAPMLDLSTPGGLGLGIVDSVSAGWGVTPTIDGKIVWFELAVADS